jgi:allantoicase
MTNYSDYTNLASAMLGTEILFATDEWFAAAGKLHNDYINWAG